jgi:hypothetical protein
VSTIRSRLRTTLGSLASRELQVRFCVHGTKSEYLLPTDILSDSVSAVRFALSMHDRASSFSHHEIEALQSFLSIVEEVGPEIPFDTPGVSNTELILNNFAWNQVREAAQNCLRDLGMEVSLGDLLRH